MSQAPVTRFDDLLLEAVTTIQAMARRGKGWDEASPEEKGRVYELGRGLAGERRYAKQANDEALVAGLEALKASAEAQLRMLEGRTVPGDEELAARLDADVATYETSIRPSESLDQ